MMQTGLGPPSATRADGDCAWLLAGLAAAQERPHLVGRVPAMTSGGAHRRDAAAAGPVGHRSLGDLEEERDLARAQQAAAHRSEEHTSELQSLMRISYAVFCLKKKKKTTRHTS